MSRSKNTDLINPSKRFFRWNGGGGTLSFYDKESKENLEVSIPFQFLVLDKLITIGGFSDEDESGIWSNEIRNTTKDILTVRTKRGIKKTGLYADVKTVTGAKFCQSLYVAFYDENKELAIGNIKLSGCAVSSWIEFNKGIDIYDGAIGISDKLEGKKGATKYFSPVFTRSASISPETNLKANDLDVELQKYLTAYFAARKDEPETDNEDYITERNREIDDGAEFTNTGKAAAAPAVNSFGSEFGGHVQPSHDDIPF